MGSGYLIFVDNLCILFYFSFLLVVLRLVHTLQQITKTADWLVDWSIIESIDTTGAFCWKLLATNQSSDLNKSSVSI